jgi:hypothetical protein
MQLVHAGYLEFAILLSQYAVRPAVILHMTFFVNCLKMLQENKSAIFFKLPLHEIYIGNLERRQT